MTRESAGLTEKRYARQRCGSMAKGWIMFEMLLNLVTLASVWHLFGVVVTVVVTPIALLLFLIVFMLKTQWKQDREREKREERERAEAEAEAKAKRQDKNSAS